MCRYAAEDQLRVVGQTFPLAEAAEMPGAMAERSKTFLVVLTA
jgi:hypothetical protein